ncbi:MAG TPA: hypothetical protein PKK00_12185 [Bacteroidales bacterium]|nr:hypothetical protein [Bacteroidales bacterium]HPS17809.1 hypothetical protein [Bacteroidales bacterium]
MKKVKIALLMLLAAVIILPSCKKGENDPFLSLKTRKARITGEWELKEGTITGVNSGTTWTRTFNGTTCTLTSGSFNSTAPYTQKITIVKDGTYKIDINDDGDLSTEEGDWYFGRKNKDLDVKTKEVVVFHETQYTSTSGTTTTTTTYTGSSCPISTITIDELKNKEIIIKYDGSSTGSFTSSYSGTLTYKQ